VGKNPLFYGDNVEVLRQNISSESVDLVYLDPPFNSNRSYNVISKRHDVASNDEAAQIQAFDDTWRWTPATDQQYQGYVTASCPTQWPTRSPRCGHCSARTTRWPTW
jgi:adenine specific DNA methylase Mod